MLIKSEGNYQHDFFLSNIAKVLPLLLLQRLKSILGFLLSERNSRVSPVIFGTRWGKVGPSGSK